MPRKTTPAGVERRDAYVTNVVKHFKFTQRGKRRIHQRPSVTEVRACRPWFDAELRVVRPSVLATLGATAAQALLGREFRITAQRGTVLEWEGLALVPTAHPSAVLRALPEQRDEDFAALVADLKQAAAARP